MLNDEHASLWGGRPPSSTKQTKVNFFVRLTGEEEAKIELRFPFTLATVIPVEEIWQVGAWCDRVECVHDLVVWSCGVRMISFRKQPAVFLMDCD